MADNSMEGQSGAGGTDDRSGQEGDSSMLQTAAAKAAESGVKFGVKAALESVPVVGEWAGAVVEVTEYSGEAAVHAVHGEWDEAGKKVTTGIARAGALVGTSFTPVVGEIPGSGPVAAYLAQQAVEAAWAKSGSDVSPTGGKDVAYTGGYGPRANPALEASGGQSVSPEETVNMSLPEENKSWVSRVSSSNTNGKYNGLSS